MVDTATDCGVSPATRTAMRTSLTILALGCLLAFAMTLPAPSTAAAARRPVSTAPRLGAVVAIAPATLAGGTERAARDQPGRSARATPEARKERREHRKERREHRKERREHRKERREHRKERREHRGRR
jgi:hypothetical protein